jgi:hypothetical protein
MLMPGNFGLSISDKATDLLRHHSLGTTPAVAAGIEESRWSLERVVEMTEAYWQPKIAKAKAANAFRRRIEEDAVFEKALSGN